MHVRDGSHGKIRLLALLASIATSFGEEKYWKPEKSIAGKSLYFIVTDRFARSGKDENDFSFCDLATAPDPRSPNGGAFCNGTLQGIIDKLDYIQGMGFDCIWITPVVKSMDYTGYFAEDFFSIEPHIGSKEILKELSDSLHKRGMCLVLDIVANHVRPLRIRSDNTPLAVKTYIGTESIVPFDKPEYFHTYGKRPLQTFEMYVMEGAKQASASQGNDSVLEEQVKLGMAHCGPSHPNMTVCNCFPGNSGNSCPGYNPILQVEGWFGQLADLNQDHPFVRQKLLEYVRYLVRDFNVDAFRLDTAIYMPKDFLTELQEAAGVDILGETTVNNLTYHAEFQNGVMTGLLNFPTFYQVSSSFCQYHLGGKYGNYHLQGAFTPQLPSLQNLASVMKEQNTDGVYSNLDLLGNFLDNHDEFARIAYSCANDSSRIKNALAWTFMSRGVPIVYYGTEQGLTGHQPNVLERAEMAKRGVPNKGQALVRESLWQTRYNTSTWQYSFIAQLNRVRKELGITTGKMEVLFDDYTRLVFTRTPPSGYGKVWIFINNNQGWSSEAPVLYCPAPDGGNWHDALTGQRAFLRHGCYAAHDGDPKVLVESFSPAESLNDFVSRPGSSPVLWTALGALVATNVVTCGLLYKYRQGPSKHFEDEDSDVSN
eukprot:TRINITY_DN54061_c0_g1_i1.p1 TRINITY_DN54061_c0_g1~~TRINITY_DN54061_c0_g1_i1.p1  ORF type:complete len:653 (+),score=112.33 TRINITY_DN54061_c0_g1_i1:40-1998(+)